MSLSSFFARLLGRPAPAPAPVSAAAHRWPAFTFELPADWDVVPANKFVTKFKARYNGPAFAFITVGAQRCLLPTDPVPMPYTDAWHAYDTIGEARFRAEFEQMPEARTRILSVRKTTFAGRPALYIDYELTPYERPEGAVRLRFYKILHEQLWFGIGRSTLVSDPHQQLTEMAAIVRTFRFTGGWAEA
ncbi:hypothetical protein EJV47_13265 [Hymenobacter gummosus]|uniref:DUF1795 domain-containing protein n=1 Tax=Hymenobacter gummosus TaxID=1776032 RepID=A0A3S0INN4_9BACT|nr:hypothetical protein [Hymenobacter gummosus]RTQ49772.1 hypothetical protein EJV47_13265 [Hymenobacter gummosus]